VKPPGDWAAEHLRYKFAATSLLEQALTHRCAGSTNNERLEFLGDSVIELIVSEQLYQAQPRADEGSLSRIRASLVKRSTLAEIAAEIHLGDFVRLGSGELKSGGHNRQSILADTLEAVLGAIFLDGGYEAAKKAILNIYGSRLENFPDDKSLKDFKTRLQETLQGRGLPPPEYVVSDVSGAAHAREFQVACRVQSMSLETTGQGTSRRLAEQHAAGRALELLTNGEESVS
jgi:ribonuclease-3